MFPKWQPISTAPKDGTKILTFGISEALGGVMRVSSWRDDTVPKGWTGGENAPAYWMPLPVPPNAAEVKANGLTPAE
jgi:hypothetical protein